MCLVFMKSDVSLALKKCVIWKPMITDVLVWKSWLWLQISLVKQMYSAYFWQTNWILPHAVNCVRFCFWRRQSVVFCLREIFPDRWTDMCQIHTEDVFVPCSDEWRSKVKVTRDKHGILQPFWRPACGLCLVKHLWPLVFIYFCCCWFWWLTDWLLEWLIDWLNNSLVDWSIG